LLRKQTALKIVKLSQKSVGIEAIAFDVPRFYVDLADLARARGIDPAKYIKGLGQREMGVASPHEDTVVLAAGAGRRLLDNFGIDPKSIDLVITGTETSVDQSKPVSVYVHQFLGLASHCRVFETKHACYGAMAGLQMATDWILSGRAAGKKALIIASDIARYGAGTPGEPTQGAGSVAMIVSDNPKLLEFETGRQGYFAQQVMDFWRPTYSKEAFADGHYSIECYLQGLIESYKNYVGNEPSFLSYLQACLYHVPFAKMAQKAHLKLLEYSRGETLTPDTEAFAAALSDYSQRVAPYLELCARVGNIYTGSLFLSLVGLLEDAVFPSENRTISLFSYGSGCVAEFMTARVQVGSSEIMKQHSYRQILDRRSKVSVEEYEEILKVSARMDSNGSFSTAPSRWAGDRSLSFAGVKDHQRQYVWSY
jgi:hydroxymethylglutaryl-CoA synthase